MKFDSKYTKTKTIRYSRWRKRVRKKDRVNYEITSKKIF